MAKGAKDMKQNREQGGMTRLLKALGIVAMVATYSCRLHQF